MPEIYKKSDLFFGSYRIKSAKLIELPTVNFGKNGTTLAKSNGSTPPKRGLGEAFSGKNAGPSAQPRKRTRRQIGTANIAVPRQAVDPPATPFKSIGIMDVGMGSCALMFDENLEPQCYFDLGYPTRFNIHSAPDNLRRTYHGVLNPNYRGVIRNNNAGNLPVVLSHWDWDHWRMGHVAAMTHVPWYYPGFQRMGPSAINFLNSLGANARPYNQALPSLQLNNNVTIYLCTPPNGLPPDMVQNNSGLNVSVRLRLPSNNPVLRDFLMTADCNFENSGAPQGNLKGITAVHHGSNNHGAADNLPNPINGTPGRIAYSYGIKRPPHPRIPARCWNFPVPAAVTKYHAVGWGNVANNQVSTGEGNNLNQPLNNIQRGNIWVGNAAVLYNNQQLNNAPYNTTAFCHFPFNLD